jgi:heptosyltransferase-1
VRKSQRRGPEISPRRILLIKPSSLGDIVHALPVVSALRTRFPQASIHWLINRAFAPLLEGHPCVDQCIPFDRRHFGRLHRQWDSAIDFLRFVHSLREVRYDWVIDLQGLFRTGFLSYATAAPLRAGFANAREFAPIFYTHLTGLPKQPIHAVDRNLAVLSDIGLPESAPNFALPISAAAQATVDQLLTENGISTGATFTALIPGARWIAKQWLPERYGELASRLIDEGLGPVVLLGSPDEHEVAQQVQRAAARELINLAGLTSLPELVAVLSRCGQIVCNDSGPMHLAAALDRPLIAIFGPTDPRRVGPYSAVARVIQTPIRPTSNHKLPDRRAMESLPVKPVLNALIEQARILD